MNETKTKEFITAGKAKKRITTLENDIFDSIRNILFKTEPLPHGTYTLYIREGVYPLVREIDSREASEICAVQLTAVNLLMVTNTKGETIMVKRGVYSTNDLAELLEAMQESIIVKED